MSGLPLEPVADVEAAASRCAAKALHSDGIPMVLVLEDMTGAVTARPPDDQPAPAGPVDRPQELAVEQLGPVLADRLAVYRQVLFPAAGGDEYWPVHDALVVVSDAHGPVAGPAGA